MSKDKKLDDDVTQPAVTTDGGDATDATAPDAAYAVQGDTGADDAVAPDALYATLDSEGAEQMVEITEEDFLRLAREQQVATIAAVVQAFSNLTPESLLDVSSRFLDQQAGMGTIILDATDATKRVEHDGWGVKLVEVSTNRDIALVRAPKDPSQITDRQGFLDFVLILGLVLTPALRAILYAHGLGLHFVQFRTSKLVYPKGR